MALCAVYCGMFLGAGLTQVEASDAQGKKNIYSVAEDNGAGRINDSFSLSGRVLFYNWGGKGMLPSLPKEGSIIGTIRDSLDVDGNVKKHLDWSEDCDISGHVNFEYLSDSGTAYGADFQVMVPEVNSAVEVGKAFINRGSRAYVLTPYGKFSLGYQEGIESVRNGGFDDFIRGKDPTLLKYRLPLLKGDFFTNGAWQWLLSNSALLYPGLYSENIFRANNYLDYYGLQEHSKHYSKYFVNNLPLRITYQSPTLYGMKFGMSYSPTGYADDLSNAWLPEDSVIYEGPKPKAGDTLGIFGSLRYLGEKAQDTLSWWWYKNIYGKWREEKGRNFSRVIGNSLVYSPAYKNVLSALWSLGKVYSLGHDEVSLDLSVGAEYASSNSRSFLNLKKGQPKGWFHDLAAVELSAAVGVRGFSAGGSYGYLGRSGYPMGPWEGTEISWGRNDARNVLKPSYYLAMGAGYKVGSFRIDGSYFYSNKGGYFTLARLSDMGLRVSYEMYKGESMRCVLFTQLHKITTNYRFAKGFLERRDCGRNGTYEVYHRGNGYKEHKCSLVKPLKYDFGLVALGVKLVF
ncbi:APH_0404 family surface protein Asp62 [Anaplasma phagocytophilum]